MLSEKAPATCPRCRAERVVGAEECIHCGIIFAKYRPLPVKPPKAPAPRSRPTPRWIQTARKWLIESDQAADSPTFYGRAALFVVLFWWGWTLIAAPLETNSTGESFLHLINLVFHEAGHVLFAPFGRFMMILGGSLGQVLIPMLCLIVLLVNTRDPFGASVALWWMGESVMDVAPYINDARAMDLILLGGVTGKETDGHDWNNILSMMGLLEWDHRLAQLTHLIGILLMLGSFLWGGMLLLRHYRRLSPRPFS
ncbi:MAG: zinc ribbon domain-containing protein [Nitrospira sp.]|nr:zinc ribbon domain-containing protein [Nitrospira sp.]